jgi:hypothetical protein
MKYIPSDENLVKFTDFVNEGGFYLRNTRVWKGRSSCVIKLPGVDADIEFKPQRDFTIHDRLMMTHMRIHRWMYRTFTVKTEYGYFVPNCNLDEFSLVNERFTERFYNIVEESSTIRLDEIKASVEGSFHEMIRWIWANNLGNDGDPPESFVNEYIKKRIKSIETPESFKNQFEYSVTKVNPEKSPEISEKVAREVYSRCINKRMAFYLYLSKSKEKIRATGNGPLKNLVRYTLHWKKVPFYGDDELLFFIDEIRHLVMRNLERDHEEICAKIDVLMNYIKTCTKYPIYLGDKKYGE